MISSTKFKPKKASIPIISLKCHLFYPSSRIIWTVVSRNNEYWIDLDLDYCSCSDYFFRTLSTKKLCYHIRNAKKLYTTNNYQSYRFADGDYLSLIASIVKDICLSFETFTFGYSYYDKFLE